MAEQFDREKLEHLINRFVYADNVLDGLHKQYAGCVLEGHDSEHPDQTVTPSQLNKLWDQVVAAETETRDWSYSLAEYISQFRADILK